MKVPAFSLSDDFSPELKLAVQAVLEGAGEVIKGYRTSSSFEAKADRKGLVTETDKATEEKIIRYLSSHSPYSILGEESGRTQGEADDCWIIDPIDGTTNFIRKLELFGVTVALLRRKTVSVGVICDPIKGTCYYAEKGKGAWLNGRQIRVSANTDPGQSILFTNHGYHTEDRNRYAAVVASLCPDYSLRTLGSTTLELCLLAAGGADGFICSGDEIWDYAAGMLLIEEASGKVTDWRGEAFDGTHSFFLASNGHIHDELVRRVGRFQRRSGRVEPRR